MIYTINVSVFFPSPTYTYNEKNIFPSHKQNIYATARGLVFRKIALK